jgi:filamentous hemagglutinin family protein
VRQYLNTTSRLESFHVLGTLVLFPLTFSVIWVRPAVAQIVPDGTLGAESSIVTPLDTLRDQIDGGAIRGSNLFHSFQDFNIDNGRGAFFSNPTGIENILTRITGGNSSNIFGTLGVLGNANLFLINPNGIVFGPNARLDVGGSFFASTAEGITFLDGYQFSATNPDVPPLLTINVPIGLQFGANPGGILNQSVATNDAGEVRGLEVPLGRTLGLVGGDIALEGGRLTAESGRVELGSVGGSSSVSLTPVDVGFALGYAGVENYQDIVLSQQALVDTRGERGGDIQVRANRLLLQDGGAIVADTSGEGQAGTLDINATESVQLIGTVPDSTLVTGLSASTFSAGNGGEININTGRLLVEDGSIISVSTRGNGQGGMLNVNAKESVELIGTTPDGVFGGLIGSTSGFGNAGTVNITTGRLILQGGASIFLGSENEEGIGGNGGILSVNATEFVELSGTAPDGNPGSGISVFTNGTGGGGSIDITTGRLIVRDGAAIMLGTDGEGRGGNLTVNASGSVEVLGTATIPGVFENESGILKTRLNSNLTASTSGTGDGGSIDITTGRLLVGDGANISLRTTGEGRGGTLTINASESVELSGVEAEPTEITIFQPEGEPIVSTLILPSQLSVSTDGVGDAGEIAINTGRFSIQDGGSISLNTNEGAGGRGGTLTINATEAVEITGTTPDGTQGSEILASTRGLGDGGNVTINTGQLLLQDGAQIFLFSSSQEEGGGRGGTDISVSTQEGGQGGSLIVNATESVELSGNFEDTEGFFAQSSLLASTFGTGDAGNITISTERLSARDGGGILANSFSLGSGGTITINATESVELIGTTPDGFASRALAVARGRGDGGSVTVETGELRVADGAEIAVSSSVFTPDELLDFELADAEIAEPLGNPGSIDITANDIRLENGGLLDAISSTGRGGNIDVRARNIQLRQGIITASGRGNDPTFDGNIDIDAQTLVLLDNSQIITSSTDPQGGSNITFRPIDGDNGALVLLQSPDSLINAQGELSVDGEIEPDPAKAPDPVVLDAESQLSRGCQDYAGSEFYVTGRGGIPPSPFDLLGGSSPIEIDWVEAPDSPEVEEPESRQETPSPIDRPLIEAQGWMVAADGTIVLTAQPHRGTPTPPALSHPDCQHLNLNAQ